MNQALFLLLIVGILLILTFLVVVFLVPTTAQGRKKSKRKVQPEVSQDMLDKAEKEKRKLEGTVNALRKQVVDFEKNSRDWEKRLAVEETKVKKLQDKLVQERQWQGEETEKYNKKAQEAQSYVNELKKVQENLSKEYTNVLRLEGEIRDVKEKLSKTNDERRKVEVELAQFKDKLNTTEDQVRKLKKDKAELSKQRNDATFVAKSEYLELEKKLKDAQKEIKDLKSK